MSSSRGWIAAAAAALVLLGGCGALPSTDVTGTSSAAATATAPSSASSRSASAPVGSPAPTADSTGPGALVGDGAAAARQQLGQMAVLAVRPSPPGYDGDCGSGHACSFGPAWSDVDRNGCDPRIIWT